MNKFDLNKILEQLSKMDKQELEKNLKIAQDILNNKETSNNLNNIINKNNHK